MTPSQLALHEAHKERLARISAKAHRPSEASANISASTYPEHAVIVPMAANKTKRVRRTKRNQWFHGVPGHLTVRDIQDEVVFHFGISRIELFAMRRTKDTVRSRHIAIYLSKIFTTQSMPEIGMRFGGQDHTTIMHAVQKIERELLRDPVLAQDVAEIELKLNALEEARDESRNANPSDEDSSCRQEASCGSPGGAEGLGSHDAQAAS